MTEQVEMIALRRFRLPKGQGFEWIEANAPYSVLKSSVAFQEKTGRGKRKTSPKIPPKTPLKTTSKGA